MVDEEQNPFYSYASRQGVLPISWDDCVALCKGLALAIAPFQPEIILGVARGGLYPATLLSHMLRTELYPIRVTSRYRDEVVYDTPIWLLQPPALVADQKVLIVDEICSEGKTITMVKETAQELGAREIRSAVLYAHTWGSTIPDYIGLVSDALILNPWDREIVQNGTFVPHPEYLHAFSQQGVEPPPSFQSEIQPRTPQKQPNRH